MWPLELSSLTTRRAVDAVGYVGFQGSVVGFYGDFSAVERVAFHFGVTLLVGLIVLGLLQEHGHRTVDTTQRSPVISTIVGVPATLALSSLLYFGYLLAESSLGVFFAVPLVVLGLAFLPTWTALGFVALGGYVSRRFGSEKLSVWLLVGSLTSAVGALAVPYGFVVVALAAVVGVGAGVRSIIGSGGVGHGEERVVPPANKI